MVVKKTKKPQKKSTPRVKPKAESAVKPTAFFDAVGRRKTAVARVRLQTEGQKEITINGKPLAQYFPTPELQQIITVVLEKIGGLDKFRISAKAAGGGLHAQAEAVRHGLARVLVKFDQEFRQRLKGAGFLTRDSRMRERKKFGLKRARRAPQWQKR